MALGGDLGEVSQERAAQLVAQTAPVTMRKHFYRTEVHQVQVAWMKENVFLHVMSELYRCLYERPYHCGMHVGPVLGGEGERECCNAA